MTTNKNFSFDVQRFTSSYTLQGAASNAVSVGGSNMSISGGTGSVNDPFIIGSSGSDTASAASTVYVKIGSGSTAELVLGSESNHISLTSASSNTKVGVKTSGRTMDFTNFIGSATMSLTSGLSAAINGTTFNIESSSGTGIALKADSAGSLNAPTLTAGEINFNSVNANWVLGAASVQTIGLNDNATLMAGNTGAVTLNSGGASSYLDFSLAKSASLSVGAGAEDTVYMKADGMKLTNLAVLGSIVKLGDSSYSVMAGSSSGIISVNDSSAANVASGARISLAGTGSSAYLTGIDKLAANGGTWSLGSAKDVTLGSQNWLFDVTGSTLTAGDTTDGSTATAVTFSSGNATLSNKSGIVQSLNVNDAKAWEFKADTGSATSVVFSQAGDISNFVASDSSHVIFGDQSESGNATSASFSTKAGDSLQVAANTTIVAGTNVSSVSGALAANSAWTVKGLSVGFDATEGTANDLSVTFAKKDSDSVYGVLTADSTGGAIAEISGLTGNATVGHNFNDDSAFAVKVMSNNWTLAGDTTGAGGYSGVAVFDSLGNASVGAATALAVSGDAGAIVTVTGSGTSNLSTINGVAASIGGDSSYEFGLEAAGTGAGIASITGLANAAVVSVEGDTSFAVGTENKNGYKYQVSTSGTDSITTFTVDDTIKGGRLNFAIQNGATYNVDGGNAIFTIASGTTDDTLNVNLNGTNVTLDAFDDNNSGVSNISITSADGDDIVAVTMNAGDAIYTDNDKEFTVVVTNTNAASGTLSTITVNDMQITVDGAYLNAATTLTVDQSGDTPLVTVTGGLATVAGNYSVTSGVYKIGNKVGTIGTAAGETPGYVTVESGGGSKVTIQTAGVKEQTDAENAALSSLTGDTAGAAVTAYQAFYQPNGRSSLSSSVQGSTVANFADGTTTVVTAEEGTTGFNLYANETIGSNAINNITLKGYGAVGTEVLNINANEGNSVTSAVVDFSSGSAQHQVVIGGSSAVTANHTVLGGSNADTIIFGQYAQGSNVAKAGSGDAYIYDMSTSGKKSSLIGGTGDDTIIAAKGDYVEGGAGADSFKDLNAHVIRDYDVTEGDVIIASKLSSVGISDLAQISARGNVISINGGAAVTLGTDYNEEDSMAAIIAGVDGSNAKYVAWASDYGSTIDASERTQGAILLGDKNNAGDSIVGSGKADTITAGGNDTVVSGAGKDIVSLTAASVEAGEFGAMVALSSDKNTVYGWTQGFDNEELGSNIIYREGGMSGVSIKASNGYLTVYESGSSLTFGDSADYDDFSFLIGAPTGSTTGDDGLDKVTYIKSAGSAEVTSVDDMADYYIAEKNGSISFAFGEDEESTLNVNLSSDNYKNINGLEIENAMSAVIVGSGNKETVSMSSTLEGASALVSLGAGNDVFVSGGSVDSALGNTFIVGTADGNDTIKSFNFYAGSEEDAEAAFADTLWIYSTDWSLSSANVAGNSKGVEITTSTNNKVVIDGATSSDIIRVNSGAALSPVNIKVGNTSGKSTFTYDADTQYYFGNSSQNKDTLVASGSDQNINIWLTDSFASSGLSDSHNNTYYGVGYVDASGLEDSSLILVGANNVNNTLVGGGEGSNSILWGGIGGNNVLVGSEGTDIFGVFAGYGNDDTIRGCSEDDQIVLAGISAADLDWTRLTVNNNFGFSSNKIEWYLNDGTKFTVANPTTAKIVLTDFTLTATNSSAGQEWSVSQNA